MSAFDLHMFLSDVFQPEAGEKILVIYDEPAGAVSDNPGWRERRVMAREWSRGFEHLGGLQVSPPVSYACTGQQNADLPIEGLEAGRKHLLHEYIARHHIVVALTEYSATAPLLNITKKQRHLRVASMPGVLRRMEQSALAADYREVARKAEVLKEALQSAARAMVTFSTGHTMCFDLRFRNAHADTGLCPPSSEHRLINLPGGEAFIVPYEGENRAVPSETSGIIPWIENRETVLFHIERNAIQRIEGEGPAAVRWRRFFEEDPARRNVAELGLGCNDRARVTGNVLEDEKAGLHWAFGRSDHLGGVTGVNHFLHASNVVHQDLVYAPACPVEAVSVSLKRAADGSWDTIYKKGMYTIC